jgi:ERCC4-type nuclease
MEALGSMIFIMDVHEPKALLEYLREKGVEPLVRAISPGDYVVGDVGIERKSLQDFFSSIIKKRIFDQLERLREEYPSHLLIVEGDLGEVRSFPSPGVFWGAFLYITLDLEIPIIFTPGLDQTASLLITLHQRMKEGRRVRRVLPRYKPRFISDDVQQRFLIQGLPGIGESLADELLKTFGSVRKVFSAGEESLKRSRGIGEKRAREITRLLDLPYKGQKKLL